MSIAAIALASLGLFALLTRRGLLRALLALQVIALSVAIYIVRPVEGPAGQDAQIVAAFILLGFFVVAIVGLALGSRLLVLSKKTGMEELTRLKN